MQSFMHTLCVAASLVALAQAGLLANSRGLLQTTGTDTCALTDDMLRGSAATDAFGRIYAISQAIVQKGTYDFIQCVEIDCALFDIFKPLFPAKPDIFQYGQAVINCDAQTTQAAMAALGAQYAQLDSAANICSADSGDLTQDQIQAMTCGGKLTVPAEWTQPAAQCPLTDADLQSDTAKLAYSQLNSAVQAVVQKGTYDLNLCTRPYCAAYDVLKPILPVSPPVDIPQYLDLTSACSDSWDAAMLATLGAQFDPAVFEQFVQICTVDFTSVTNDQLQVLSCDGKIAIPDGWLQPATTPGTSPNLSPTNTSRPQGKTRLIGGGRQDKCETISCRRRRRSGTPRSEWGYNRPGASASIASCGFGLLQLLVAVMALVNIIL